MHLMNAFFRSIGYNYLKDENLRNTKVLIKEKYRKRSTDLWQNHLQYINSPFYICWTKRDFHSPTLKFPISF